MFTGIIEEIGRVRRISPRGSNLILGIGGSKIATDLNVGDSININGACQTITELKDGLFTAEAVEETLRRTNLGQLRMGDGVNLERALRHSDRLGGHLVTGHVDFAGSIKSVMQKDGSCIFEIEFPQEYRIQFVEKGSVTVDGVSLTVAQVLSGSITVSVIPFTMSNTTLGEKKIGDAVNIETDLIGKYVERILTAKKDKFQITEEWLREKGW
ncbi:MAG: riboflavin synthase [Candidatus Zixiibacteriota bacterium]